MSTPRIPRIPEHLRNSAQANTGTPTAPPELQAMPELATLLRRAYREGLAHGLGQFKTPGQRALLLRRLFVNAWRLGAMHGTLAGAALTAGAILLVQWFAGH